MYRQARYARRLITELKGGTDFILAHEEVNDIAPPGLIRKELVFPSVPEREVVKHYTNLSQMNYGVDNGIYPLGSCTMKYNPKYADLLASLPTATNIHPYQDETSVQGALEIMYELERALCVIGGVDAVTLQPAAGAQGEFTGMLLAKAYHQDRGEERDEVIVPDSAHGTNPASAAMAGYKIVEIPSSERGCVDLDALEAALTERTAAFMITNPNTLGIFEEGIERISRKVHDHGALLYYDGANLNAIMGYTTPGAMDFDIVHFNLHKTFATPHGGGGPGAGPVGVKAHLEPFLPVPRVVLEDGRYMLDHDREKSIGKVRAFYGNFLVLLRAYAYIMANGGDGLKLVSQKAVLNSNYLKERLKGTFDLPFKDLRKHEFVIGAGTIKKERDIRTLDIAKRLLDYGFHSPTVYFPPLVEEAMMIEPTESETKEALDEFAEALIAIASEEAEVVKNAPTNTAAKRVDEVLAAKQSYLSTLAVRRKGEAAIGKAKEVAATAECTLCKSITHSLLED